MLGPLEWFCHGSVEVIDESQHLVSQVFHRTEVAAVPDLTNQDAEPDLDQVNANAIDWTLG